MSTYRAAVIGLGRMGSTFDDEMTRGGSVFLPYCHGPAYIHSPKTELVAGADIHDEQRAIFGERWGLTDDQLYSDFEEMLEKAKPDIVSVCTTARIRSEIVHKVARAGVKAIWAEKPLAFSLEEGDEMVRVCREEGVSLAVNCARRWNPMYSQARNIIAAGHIGNVLQVTAHAACQLSSNGSHLLDTVRFLAGGDVQWVLGEMESDEAAGTDGDIMGNGYLVFDNGVRAFVRSMKASGAGWDFDVIGENGRVRTPNDAQAWELTSMTGEEFPPVENRRPGVRARKLSGHAPVSVADPHSRDGPDNCRRYHLVDRERPPAEVLWGGRAQGPRDCHRNARVPPARLRPRGPAAGGPQPEDGVERDGGRRGAGAHTPGEGRGVGLRGVPRLPRQR